MLYFGSQEKSLISATKCCFAEKRGDHGPNLRQTDLSSSWGSYFQLSPKSAWTWKSTKML